MNNDTISLVDCILRCQILNIIRQYPGVFAKADFDSAIDALLRSGVTECVSDKKLMPPSHL